ncbi:MAG: TRAP transporter small permease [Spirochaetales bacterium]|nr:TRAP transporter small permease [Spirochaetales bacterium]
MKDIINKVLEVYEQLCRVLLAAMTSLVIIFVFLRYFFGVTFVWAEELITMLFISTTYFGAVLGMRYKEHISISFLAEKLPPKVHSYIEKLNYLIILIVQIALTRTSLQWIGKVGNVLTNGMRLPIRYFYWMMPISCVLIGIYCVLFIVTPNRVEAVKEQN